MTDTPGPVGGLDATNVTKTTAQLSWLPPENDGGSQILNYIVEKREVDRKTWNKCSEDLKKTSFKVTNMSPGMDYYFRVMACNKYGIGLPQDSPRSYLAVDPISKSATAQGAWKLCFHMFLLMFLRCGQRQLEKTVKKKHFNLYILNERKPTLSHNFSTG